MEREPVQVFSVHESLRQQCVRMSDSDMFFDRFEIGISGDGRSFITGSYQNTFHVKTRCMWDVDHGPRDEVEYHDRGFAEESVAAAGTHETEHGSECRQSRVWEIDHTGRVAPAAGSGGAELAEQSVYLFLFFSCL